MAEQDSPDGSSKSGPKGSPPPDPAQPADGSEWRRRRRLAEVFGDVLPVTTSDERDAVAAPDSGDATEETPQDRWLRSQVPPHHG